MAHGGIGHPLITSNGTVSIAENTTAVTTVTAAIIPEETLSYSISGADASKFTIDPTTGALSFVTAPNFEAPTDAGGNNVYDLYVTASTVQGGTDTQAIAVTVFDVNDMTDFTLTTGSDTIAGTAADDTVNGTAATLNSGDSLTGGAGTDVLALSGGGSFHVDQLATFAGFESITLNTSTTMAPFFFSAANRLQ